MTSLTPRGPQRRIEQERRWRNIGGTAERRTGRAVAGYFDDWPTILEEVESLSDRAAAIVGVALLDSRLEKAFRAIMLDGLSQDKLNDLFEGPTAPLGSYSGKARVAHALGIIGERSFADLKKLGKIRNLFAHELHITSFEHEDVRQLCDQLQLTAIRSMGQDPPATPKEKFIHSTVLAAKLMYSELVTGTPLGTAPDKSP